MRSVVVGSLMALILSAGLVVSQVEAKKKDDDGYKQEYKENGYKQEYKENGQYRRNGSVPIPGTLLLFGGGFIGLMIWRTRDPRS